MPTNELQNQIAKLRRDKKILWLGILFFVLVVLWILVGIFATSRTSTIAPELREMAKPFVPRLESKAFEEILSKRVFSEEELALFSIFTFDQNSLASDPLIIDIIGEASAVAEVITEEQIETEAEIEIEIESEATSDAEVEATAE